MDHHLAFLSKIYPAGGAGDNEHEKGSTKDQLLVPKSQPTAPISVKCFPGTSPIPEEPPDDESTTTTNQLVIPSPRILLDNQDGNNSNNNKTRKISFFKRPGHKTKPPKTKPSRHSTATRGRTRSRSSSTNRRRRHSTGTDNNHHLNMNKKSDTTDISDPITMDAYIQKSSRVQSFLGHAWQHVKHASSSHNKENKIDACTHEGNGHTETQALSIDKNHKHKRIRHDQALGPGSGALCAKDNNAFQQHQDNEDKEHYASSRVLREQTTEIWRLKRQLEQVQQEQLALQTTNETLRQELFSSQNRAQRAKTALRTASENARTARADADAAKTTAAQLAKQLQDLQIVVQETQKATQLLKDDQTQIQQTASRAETTLHQKSLELTRAQQLITQHQAQQEFFQATKTAWERQRQLFQSELMEKTKLIENLERQNHESRALAEARLERLQGLQQEWGHAQTLLEEVTQSKLQTEQTVLKLSEAVTQLQTANEELHQQLQALQMNSHEHAIQQQNALSQAEKTGLKLKIQKESLQEELNRFQQMGNQKTVANNKSTTRFSLPPLATHNKTTDTTSTTVNDEGATKTTQVSLPPVDQVTKANTEPQRTAKVSKSPHDHCGICGGPGYGLMKRCQCGRAACRQRVHLVCANQLNSVVPSIAHPGTPVPRSPLFLCGTTADTKQSSSNSTL